jgi:hypothetical protein
MSEQLHSAVYSDEPFETLAAQQDYQHQFAAAMTPAAYEGTYTEPAVASAAGWDAGFNPMPYHQAPRPEAQGPSALDMLLKHSEERRARGAGAVGGIVMSLVSTLERQSMVHSRRSTGMGILPPVVMEEGVGAIDSSSGE